MQVIGNGMYRAILPELPPFRLIRAFADQAGKVGEQSRMSKFGPRNHGSPPIWATSQLAVDVWLVLLRPA